MTAKRPRKRASGPPEVAATPDLALGRTGRTHPPIGLGLWSVGRWSPEFEARTRQAIDRGLARGLRWYDTAEVYGAGRSERLLGDALSEHRARPEELLVATKVSWEHLRARQLRAALTGSLQRLGRSSVDLYLVHAPDPRVPIAETMGALEALHREGKIGAIGVSNFGPEELEAAEAALSETAIVVNQVRFNLFDREEADPVLEACRRRGIVVEAYTPLLRGLLAGRYLDGARPPSDVRLLTHRLLDDESLDGIVARARRIRDLARDAKVPMASIALHWLRARGAAPLFGASRPEQIDEVLAAFASVPPPSVLAEADRIGREAGLA